LLRENFGLPAAAVIPNMHRSRGDERIDKPSTFIQVSWVANSKS
jgi:hypothetical protein